MPSKEGFMSDTTSVIREFLINSDQPIDAVELDRSNDLLEDGLLDSLGLMVVVQFLTDHYSVEFQPNEIVPENFATVEAMAALVDGKLQPGG
jgi:acyl carrier protein